LSENKPQEKVTPWLKIQLLSAAGGLSFMGSSLTTFAVILRDKDAVGPAGVSIILLSMLVPNLLMAPFSGQIADRFPSRRVVPLALLAMSISTISIALIPETWWAPFALFTTATFGSMVGAASSATVGYVSRPEDMARVTGIQQTYVSMGSLAGPAAGGILVGTTGYFWPFVIDSVSFLILALVFLSTGLNRPSVEHLEGEKPRALDGFRFLFSQPVLRAIMIILMVVILALGVISVGEVFLIVDELGADEITYGLIGALFAGGSLVSALMLQAIKIKAQYHSIGLLVSLSLTVSSFAVLSQVREIWVAALIYFLAGFGNAGVNIFAIGQVQRLAKEEVRGRIMAAVQGSVTAGNLASLGFGGILIGIFGVREVFLAGGILALTALVVFGPQLLKSARNQ
jgi:MFS family permease